MYNEKKNEGGARKVMILISNGKSKKRVLGTERLGDKIWSNSGFPLKIHIL